MWAWRELSQKRNETEPTLRCVRQVAAEYTMAWHPVNAMRELFQLQNQSLIKMV
jgi:hypothetical protein